jgi:hypothetical protein
MAVKSATKAEEGAKRWLSFMSRDCNRFCKIMVSSSSTVLLNPTNHCHFRLKGIARIPHLSDSSTDVVTFNHIYFLKLLSMSMLSMSSSVFVLHSSFEYEQLCMI